jgi:hypothetical protein
MYELDLVMLWTYEVVLISRLKTAKLSLPQLSFKKRGKIKNIEFYWLFIILQHVALFYGDREALPPGRLF